MKRIFSIMALAAASAFGQLHVDPSSNWQSIVQTMAPSATVEFAAGSYQTTGTWLSVTSGWAVLTGAGIGQTVLSSGSGTNWGVVRLSGTAVRMIGFSVVGGSTSNRGGGVSGTGGQSLSNCAVSNCSASVGGGTYLVDLYGCIVKSNACYSYSGGGQSGGGSMLSATGTAEGCSFSNNYATYDGGGVAGTLTSYSSTGQRLLNCVVSGNSARDGGGAIYVFATNCLIVSNVSRGSFLGGGGIKNSSIFCSTVAYNTVSSANNGGGAYSVVASNVWFVSNTCGGSGGGGYGLYGTNLVLLNNSCAADGGGTSWGVLEATRIHGNVASNRGGGIHSTKASRCLISSNRSVNYGSGSDVSSIASSCVYSGNYGSAYAAFNCTLLNCTVYGHTNTFAAVSNQNATYRVANTIVWGNATNEITPGTNTFDNWTADPIFSSTATNPWMLSASSPCVNSGNDAYVPGTLDFYGRSRQVGQVDVGAVEYQPGDDPDTGSSTLRRNLFTLMGVMQ